MEADELQFMALAVPNGGQGEARKIAYKLYKPASGRGPCLLWLSGFLSDMSSTKVSALAEFAAARRLSLMRFDYSGHGLSSGEVAHGSISDWLEESLAALAMTGEGPCIVIGSSMGGWLALLLAQRLAQSNAHSRLAGIVLIAPAWDMTEALMWQRLPEAAKSEIDQQGIYFQPSNYDAPYPISRHLIEDGRKHLLQGSRLDTGCPIRILQGMRDPDVPWEHALRLVDLLGNDDVELDLIKDGDHRLSRPQDIRRLKRTIEGLIADGS